MVRSAARSSCPQRLGSVASSTERGTSPTSSQRPIELSASEIIAPAAPNRRRMVQLSYAGITDLKVDTEDGEAWLYIRHRNGKLAISSEAMESYTAFQRMLTSLELRVSLARGAARKAG